VLAEGAWRTVTLSYNADQLLLTLYLDSIEEGTVSLPPFAAEGAVEVGAVHGSGRRSRCIPQTNPAPPHGGMHLVWGVVCAQTQKPGRMSSDTATTHWTSPHPHTHFKQTN